MKLTEPEKRLVLANRHRLALDARNWDEEPFITRVQLEEMSEWRADLFNYFPKRWRYDPIADVMWNILRPTQPSDTGL